MILLVLLKLGLIFHMTGLLKFLSMLSFGEAGENGK